MFKTIALFSIVFLFPLVTLAAGTVAGGGAGTGPDATFGSIGTVIQNVVKIMNNVLVPAIFAIAFLVFIWGMFQHFILGGADEEAREKGKQLMIYGIIGFVLMLSVWGLVNVVASGLGFMGDAPTDIPKATLPGVNTD